MLLSLVFLKCFLIQKNENIGLYHFLFNKKKENTL